MTVPIGRGASSLVVSRLADLVQALTAALVLPAGLVAAGTVELMRGLIG
ncbi:hypothetical protein [Cellulomonas denverensis]